MIKVDNKRPMGHITAHSNLVVLLYFRSQNHQAFCEKYAKVAEISK